MRSCSVFGNSTCILPIRIQITKADPVHLSHPSTALHPSNLSHPPQCLVDLNPVSISSLPSVSSIPSLSSILSIHTLHLIPPSHPFHPCRFTPAVSSIWGSYVSYGPCPSSIPCFSSLSSLLSSSISALLMSPNAHVVHTIYLIYLHPQDRRQEADTASQTRWTRQHERQVGRKTGDKLGDQPNGHDVPDELEKLHVHLDASRAQEHRSCPASGSASPVECSCHPRVFMHRFLLAIFLAHNSPF